MRTPLALALSAVLTLSACGGGGDGDASSYADSSPEEVAKDVRGAMAEVKSLRIAGNIVDDGNEIDIDLALAEGGNCEGEMSVAGTGSFELLVTDGKAFFKADEQFWTSQGEQGAAVAQMVGDKWVAATGQMANLTSVCNFEEFVSDFSKQEENKFKDVTGTSEVDGEETVTVDFTSDEGNKGVAHVLAEEPHHVVKFVVEKEGEMVLSDFDEPVEPDAPAASDVVDLEKLG